ncbi:putative conserved Mce associated membrane protein [Mycobacterium xenopi 4042]|uniref:Putative conserved Mce associated membrane protein n=1 Tax=Mycobacterium xenopi 4042 TaxID=1299334 RepID=X8BJC7_MYCXE|nr:putative conserved Mce associated membrane protein [Mycobacterium xenopi 4042]
MPRRWGRGRRARIGTDAATSGGIDKDSATDTATEDRVEAGPVETDAPHREVADHKSDAGVAETSSGDEEQDADAEAEDAADMSDQDGAPARRPAGKRLVIAVGVAAALFVGSAAFAGLQCSLIWPIGPPWPPSSRSRALQPMPSPRCGPTHRTIWTRWLIARRTTSAVISKRSTANSSTGSRRPTSRQR